MSKMGRADTHVHTIYSGIARFGVLKFPESVVSPEKQVDNARKNGMDVLCITDHNETYGAFAAQKYAKKYDDIDVIAGEEVMTSDGEIIGLFLNERVPEGLTAEETVDIVRSQGGLTIAPHPFSTHVCGLQEKMFEVDIDGIEVINGGHVDPYSNAFAKTVAERYPGRWAQISGSDAHSRCTSGYNWTEFEGNTAEDFRKAVLNRTTVPVGTPAPVLTEVQWSMEVVYGGQKLMAKSLMGKLPDEHENHIIEKINSITALKKVAGIVGGMVYLVPFVSMIGTVLSTSFLKKTAKKANAEADKRLAIIDEMLSQQSANSV
ncbi:MAG: PHP domain-containing protein [Candidatus Methanomethylophilaceae archaeon]|jgi:predicted metal-dependent phosphoesterase TrpH